MQNVIMITNIDLFVLRISARDFKMLYYMYSISSHSLALSHPDFSDVCRSVKHALFAVTLRFFINEMTIRLATRYQMSWRIAYRTTPITIHEDGTCTIHDNHDHTLPPNYWCYTVTVYSNGNTICLYEEFHRITG